MTIGFGGFFHGSTIPSGYAEPGTSRPKTDSFYILFGGTEDPQNSNNYIVPGPASGEALARTGNGISAGSNGAKTATLTEANIPEMAIKAVDSSANVVSPAGNAPSQAEIWCNDTTTNLVSTGIRVGTANPTAVSLVQPTHGATYIIRVD